MWEVPLLLNHRKLFRYFLGSEVFGFAYENDDVMKEIMANGPLVAEFILYEDFLSYSSGIYEHVTGNEIGYYYAKILGWGLDLEKEAYWIGAASFGSNWGKLKYCLKKLTKIQR